MMRFSSTNLFFRGTARLLTLFTLALTGLVTAASAQTYQVLYDALRTTGTNSQDFKFTQARDGNLYVTANAGGIVNGNCLFGCGQILTMTPTGFVTQIHAFDIVAEGASPRGGLTLGTDGNLYGVLSTGGTSGLGSVFKITTAGAVTILHSFSDTGDGASPAFPPIQATDGNFYGSVGSSGSSGNGVLYKLTSSGKFTVLHTFNRNVDGDGGQALVQGTDGKLYTVAAEGAGCWATVLQFTTTGTVKVLHNFACDQSEGISPFTPVQAPDGSFYGVCNQGGAQSSGTIWKITPGGVFKLLHSVNGTTEGQYPADALSLGTDGKLYGLTQYQGVNGAPGTGGTIFQFTTAGVYSVLFSFTGGNGASGSFPNTILTQDTNGLFYGITAYGGGGSDPNGTFYNLNNGLAPFVALQTTSGKIGTQVSILGQGFNNTSVVKFGGVAATTAVLTGTTYIVATVPVGALTGSITVATGATTLTSTKTFKVTPAIIGFTPPHGLPGTSVVITGSELTQATKVTFGGVAAASFTVNSDSQITATVPAGAKTGKIGVTTKGGAAISAATFTVG